MNREAIPYLVSPIKKSPLHLVKQRKSKNKNRIVSGFLVSADKTESFWVTAGIPLLLPLNYPAEATYPVYEVLLGNEAFNVVSRFAEAARKKGGPKKFDINLSSYIEEKLGRHGVIKAFEEYGNIPVQRRYESFIRIPEEERSIVTPAISKREFAKGLNRVQSRTAKERLKGMSPKASPLSEYAKSVADMNPKIMLELGCGACFGTQAVVEHYRSFERLFTIDIDFVCTKVAEGLYIYQGESHRIDPIVSSFWFLPFRGGSIDSVFTRGGLAESREVDRVLQEVYRVLKLGGRFVCLEPSKPYLLPLFGDLGFSMSEIQHLASIARLYAGADNLCEMALSTGLKAISRKKVFSPGEGLERVLCVFEK